MADKYKVIKKWGKHHVGEILKESKEVRRKLKEGGCVEKIAPETSKNKKQTDSTAKNKGDN